MRKHHDSSAESHKPSLLDHAIRAAGPSFDMTAFAETIKQAAPDESALRDLLAQSAARLEIEHVQALLALGAKDDAPMPDRRAIQYAASRGRPDMVRALLDSGADPNAGLPIGERSATPLREAIRTGSARCVELLASRGADIESYDMGHWSAMVSAASRGQAECVDVLLKAGADKKSRTLHDLGALEVAASNHRALVIDVLIAREAIPPDAELLRGLAMQAAIDGDFATLRALSSALDIDAPPFASELQSRAMGDAAQWLRCRREAREIAHESAGDANLARKRASI